MDDNQDSRASDAAATRKRRSSILKCQRSVRTPFSELEFNVATPTDTAKSRRVSFSRRTGVAEFVTNEATTTWKNFYEEHNKSLESSGNDSDANACRQPVEHLGRRIFDQQFEIEAVDLIGTITPSHSVNLNFTEQITSADEKLTAPNIKFDFSALTDHQTKLFGNDFNVTTAGEPSGKIDFDFSNIQKIEDKDDLDEIDRDLKRVVFPGPADRHNISEYIEVDLNMTNAPRDGYCDMSITDTIQSPKVQDVSKSSTDKKNSLSKDWMTDKENIAVNPYASLIESDKFVINDEPDQVLVFDGKRVSVQTEKERNPPEAKVHVRKTIVLNTNDDLPNFADDARLKSDLESKNKSYLDQNDCVKAVHKVDVIKRSTINDNVGDISITESLPADIIKSGSNKSKTIIQKGNVTGNMSITQSLNGILFMADRKPNNERRRTVVYDNDSENMSVTRALPTNILLNDDYEANTSVSKLGVYDVKINSPDESINDLNNDLNMTNAPRDGDCDMSITDTIQSPKVQDVSKSSTDKKVSLSKDWMTDKENIAVNPYASLIESDKFVINDEPDQVLVFDGKRISVQNEKERNPPEAKVHVRKTIVLNTNDLPNFADDARLKSDLESKNKSNLDQNDCVKAVHKVDVIKRSTINDNVGDISITESLPADIIKSSSNKSKIIIQKGNVTGNMSITQSLNGILFMADRKPNNERRRTVVYDNDSGNMSVTRALPTNILLNDDYEANTSVSKLEVYDVKINSPDESINDLNNDLNMTNAPRDGDCDMSITDTIQSPKVQDVSKSSTDKKVSLSKDWMTDKENIAVNPYASLIESDKFVINDEPDQVLVFDGKRISVQNEKERYPPEAKVHVRKTIVLNTNDLPNFADDARLKSDLESKNKSYLDQNTCVKAVHKVDVIKRSTINDNVGDISFTESLPADIIKSGSNKSKTIIQKGNVTGNMSITQSLNGILFMADRKPNNERRRTVVYDNDSENMSVTRALPTNILLNDGYEANTSVSKLEVYDVKINSPDESINDLNNDLNMTNAPRDGDCDMSITDTIQSPKVQDVSKSSTDKKVSLSKDWMTDKENIAVNPYASRIESDKFVINDEPDQVLVFDGKRISVQTEKERNPPEAKVHVRKTIVLNTNDLPNFADDARFKSDLESKNKSYLDQNDCVKAVHKVDVIKRSTINDNVGDISITESLPADIIKSGSNKSKTIIQKGNVTGNMSITQSLNVILFMADRKPNNERRRTVVYDNDSGNMFATRALPTNILLNDDYEANTSVSKLEVSDVKINSPDESINDLNNDISTANSVSKIVAATIKSDNSPISYEPNYKHSKTSVLESLLDMTDPPASDTHEKYAETSMEALPVEAEPEPEEDASTIDFTMAEDQAVQTYEIEADIDAKLTQNEGDSLQLIRDSPLSIESTEKCPQNNLSEVIDITEEQIPTAFDKDEHNSEKLHKNKSFKDANDTAELLDMICDITDTNRSVSKEEGTGREISNHSAMKESVATDHKNEMHEPRRLSFATKRKSIIISRENLLNNISMAQAALQKSRIEFQDTVIPKDPFSSPLTNRRKLSDRLSHEVVKTLDFEDESLSEHSLKSDNSTCKTWAIKKVVKGETSPSKHKANVIPSYLKDVSDGIKQLMSDLVKPMSDAIPFQSQEERLKRSISTVSTQIQANLITSSQIDVDAELSSSASSHEYIQDTPSDRSESNWKSADSSKKPSEQEMVPTEFGEHTPCVQHTSSGDVLLFENPLNNIHLGTLDYVHAHDYNPIRTTLHLDNSPKKSDETLCGLERDRSCQITMDSDADLVNSDTMKHEQKNIQVNTETYFPHYRVDVLEPQSKQNARKSILIDKAVHAHSEVDNTPVNTIIAMKSNKELLESSSALTIHDESSKSLNSSDSKTTSSQYYVARRDRKSPLKTTFKVKEETSITSTDEDSCSFVGKGKKRIYVPVTPSRRATIDVTPKPNSKVLKMSNSPNPNRILLRMSHEPTKIPAERDTESNEQKSHSKNIEDEENTKNKLPNCSYGETITIQQLITEYKIDTDMNNEVLDALKDIKYCKSESLTTEAPSRSASVTSDAVEEVSSFASSKDFKSAKQMPITATVPPLAQSESTVDVTESAKIGWQPELCNVTSNKGVTHFDSGVNIVSKIDMLPFMGSYECERESSSADTWSFRLLHGRIRLTIRLAHRHDNATRTRVRADTPVTDISVDTIEYDKKNPVAILCIRFACETMRYMVCSRSDASYLARDVPLLLRRCAAVARVALRWGRAMHDAKLHLTYTLDTEGHLNLKVANIPLRSVWEVSMDLELVLEHPSQAPWPRASNVKVHRVVSDLSVSEEDVRRALKHTSKDWGHAPKTLWRIFKYLKHKQRDDDAILDLGL